MSEQTQEQWFRIHDAKGAVSHVRGRDYEDAAEQLVAMRRKQGQYRECPEYNALLLLIGGPINPVRVEVFEYVNQGNGMAVDAFHVIREDDYLDVESEKTKQAMARSQFRGGTGSERFG